MTRVWETIKEYNEIKYEYFEGIGKITINRPHVRNAFTPNTVMEMIDAFSRARDDQRIGAIILTGEGDMAFCSGGDQKVRGHAWIRRRRQHSTSKRFRSSTFNPSYS